MTREPNPTALPAPLDLADLDRGVQRLHCSRRNGRDGCLTAMSAVNARGWSCLSCGVQERVDDDELRGDVPALSALGAAIGRAAPIDSRDQSTPARSSLRRDTAGSKGSHASMLARRAEMLELIAANPDQSDRWIALQLGLSYKTVAIERQRQRRAAKGRP